MILKGPLLPLNMDHFTSCFLTLVTNKNVSAINMSLNWGWGNEKIHDPFFFLVNQQKMKEIHLTYNTIHLCTKPS